MNYLYLITEDDNDDLFYEGCLEKLTRQAFQLDQTRRRLRKGGGIKEARRMLRLVLREIRHTGFLENVYIVVAVDNDRAPEHPHHGQVDGLNAYDCRKTCQFCELESMFESELGEDHSLWPINGAIAIPVEMLESWLLLIAGHQTDGLPIFGRKDQPIAQNYYSPRIPPDQLKDLCKLEIQKSSSNSMGEFCLVYATDLLDPDDLASKSPSFAHFKSQVESWT